MSLSDLFKKHLGIFEFYFKNKNSLNQLLKKRNQLLTTDQLTILYKGMLANETSNIRLNSIETIKGLADRLMSNIINEKKDIELIENLKIAIDKQEKNNNTIFDVLKIFDSDFDKDLSYGDSKQNNSGIYKFFSPYYLIYGLISLIILLFSGYYNEFSRYFNLELINITLVLIFLFLLYQYNLFLRNRNFYRISNLFVFLTTVFILSLSLFNFEISSINYFNSDRDFNNFQIVLCLILVFMPVFFNLLILAYYSLRLSKIETRIFRINSIIDMYSTLTIPTISETIFDTSEFDQNLEQYDIVS